MFYYYFSSQKFIPSVRGQNHFIYFTFTFTFTFNVFKGHFSCVTNFGPFYVFSHISILQKSHISKTLAIFQIIKIPKILFKKTFLLLKYQKNFDFFGQKPKKKYIFFAVLLYGITRKSNS